jgi:hypothetical protein
LAINIWLLSDSPTRLVIWKSHSFDAMDIPVRNERLVVREQFTGIDKTPPASSKAGHDGTGTALTAAAILL